MSRKLDIAIAKALGYSVYHYDKDVAERCYCMLMDAEFEPVMFIGGERKTEAEAWDDVHDYSTDGNAMLDLDKEMQARGWMVKIIFWGAMFKLPTT